jgi:hypothetical protein
MPITFTEGLTPNFPPGSFDSELEHVKLLYAQVEAGGAYVNILQPLIDTMVAKINTRSAEFSSLAATINGDISSLSDMLVVPTDPNATPPHSQPLIDPLTGLPYSNIPECWDQAGLGGGDISSIISALSPIVTNLDIATNTLFPELIDEVTTIDVDNFKLHMDLWSGVDEAPPPGIIKPNNQALMGMIRAVTDIENRFGIAFVNYLELVFETLFLGDLTILNTQADLDADPFVGLYGDINVVSRVSSCPAGNFAPSLIIADINAFSANHPAWNTEFATNKAIFQQHVIDDMAEYDSLTDKLARYVQAYNISAYIQDPYYRFMYTDVFGSQAVVDISTQLANGEIK